MRADPRVVLLDQQLLVLYDEPYSTRGVTTDSETNEPRPPPMNQGQDWGSVRPLQLPGSIRFQIERPYILIAHHNNNPITTH